MNDVLMAERTINTWPYSQIDGMIYNWETRNNKWTECNSDSYWSQLECLPPHEQDGNAFQVGEIYDHDSLNNWVAVYGTFVKIDGRFFGKIMSSKEFNINTMEREIRSQFEF